MPHDSFGLLNSQDGIHAPRMLSSTASSPAWGKRQRLRQNWNSITSTRLHFLLYGCRGTDMSNFHDASVGAHGGNTSCLRVADVLSVPECIADSLSPPKVPGWVGC
jgi:hypothetical protein